MTTKERKYNEVTIELKPNCGPFMVICINCGSGNVRISDYSNDYSEGVRFTCKSCGTKTEL